MTDAPHPAAIDVAGTAHLRDARGRLVPIETIKPIDLLMDELVREQLGKARAISALLSAFKTDAFVALAELQTLLAQDYDATLGGTKGNITLLTFDGCMKVQLQVADVIDFGPELQAAKSLIDACLTEWSAGGAAELRAIVNRVFQVDKEGKVNPGELFMLLRVESPDERWKRAMDAIKDSIRVIGSRRYVRFYERQTPDGAWQAVTLDLASAKIAVTPAA